MLLRFVLAFTLISSTAFASTLKDFSDYQIVPNWAVSSFNVLLKDNVISGTANKKLKPNNTINRAEFLKILIEATNQTLVKPAQPSFSDVKSEHWFYPYVETAAALNWANGYPNGTFKPGNTINRAEIAKLINKAFNITVEDHENDKNWYDSHVRSLTDHNLLPYNVGQTAFNPSRAPSRAEAFEQMYRARLFKSNGKQTTLSPSSTTKTTSSTAQTSYTPPATFSRTIASNPTAGQLSLKRPNSQAKSIVVAPGQQNVNIAQLEITAQNGPVELSGLQLRRIGNGTISNFSSLWFEKNSLALSPKLIPNQDLVSFNFSNTLELNPNQTLLLNLQANLATNAKIGSSERFVLYLPDWINANTDKKIGFFPLGGSNIEIK